MFRSVWIVLLWLVLALTPSCSEVRHVGESLNSGEAAASTGPYAVHAGPRAPGESARPYDCRSLDYGLYWYHNANASRKAYSDGRDIVETVNGKTITFYRHDRPTIIYVHGWQRKTVRAGYDPDLGGGSASGHSSGREEFYWSVMNKDGKQIVGINVADHWVRKGWNVGIFHWTQLADDDDTGPTAQPYNAQAKIWSTSGPAGMRWRDCNGDYQTSGAPTKPVHELFADAYRSAMQRYTGTDAEPVRVVGHSLGHQVVVNGVWSLYSDAGFPAERKPKRVALLDPYWSPADPIWPMTDPSQLYSYLRPFRANDKVPLSPAGIIADRVVKLKSNQGLVFEWYRSSWVSQGLAGDGNERLAGAIGMTWRKVDALTKLDGAGRHTAAMKYYFWSLGAAKKDFASPPEVICSNGRDCLPVGKDAASAATSLARTREIMNSKRVWVQRTGMETLKPEDDSFEAVPNGSVRLLGNEAEVARAVDAVGSEESPLGGLSAGRRHMVSLKQDGSAWAWGDNTYGQLGDGTTASRAQPVAVAMGSPAVAVAAGPEHNLALAEDGTVWGWGSNYAGQLGLRSPGYGGPSTSPTPVRIPGFTDVVAIAAASNCSAMVRADGTVWVAGGGGYFACITEGQPASGVATQVMNLSDVVDVKASGNHTLALKRDGSVWAWGFNVEGALGDAGASGNYSLTPVQSQGLSNITSIAAAGNTSYAVTATGDVWSWGSNDAGQLGIGAEPSATPKAFVPTKSEMRDVVDLVASPTFLADETGPGAPQTVIARKFENTTWTWGAVEGYIRPSPIPHPDLEETEDGALTPGNGGFYLSSFPRLHSPRHPATIPVGLTEENSRPDYNASYDPSDALLAALCDEGFSSYCVRILPRPWRTEDVGASGQVGAASEQAGTFTVRGAGAEIGAQADALRFVYQELSGDVSVTARVATQQAGDAAAKAGVMIRTSLDEVSAQASMLFTPQGPASFSWRDTAGQMGDHVDRAGVKAPAWVRIQRLGSSVIGLVSTDGATWTEVGRRSFDAASPVFVGLAVNSHGESELSTATFDNVGVAR